MNIVSDVDGGPHITARDSQGRDIVGAYQPEGVLTWRLYFTNLVETGPHNVHPVVCNREHALQWVTVIAALYEAAHPVVRALMLDAANVAGHAWSDFPNCDCPAFQAADLDDHQTSCTARRQA